MQQQIFLSISKEELQALIVSCVKGIFPASSNPLSRKYLTRRELSEQLGISLPTLDGLVRTGKVKSYKISSRILFKSEEIDSFLETQRYI